MIGTVCCRLRIRSKFLVFILVFYVELVVLMVLAFISVFPVRLFFVPS